MDESVVLRFFHGGQFTSKPSLEYLGGQLREFSIDPNMLCTFRLVKLAKKCGDYKSVENVYYVKPGMDLNVGLTIIYDDDDVRDLLEIVTSHKAVDIYVTHGVDESFDILPSHISNFEPLSSKTILKKFTPRRMHEGYNSKASCTSVAQTNTIISHKETQIEEDNDDWVDNRPEIPIPYKDLFDYYDGNSDDDSDYQPDNEFETESENPIQQAKLVETKRKWSNFREPKERVHESEFTEDECDVDELLGSQTDTSDEEYHGARAGLAQWNQQRVVVLERVVQGSLDESKKQEVGDRDLHSDYEDSGGEMQSDVNSEGEPTAARKGADKYTNFKTFKWCLGMRFPNRLAFKDVVIRYAIAQGFNLRISASDKNRGGRIGVSCEAGCPFSLYASWESNRSCFLLKTVQPGHNCHRDMKRNRCMKSRWAATQFLEIFKEKPHWPAKDIMDAVRTRFGIIIERGVAYKIKHFAHQMLHGSMLEHYSKLGKYLEALRHTTILNDIILVTYPDAQVQRNPPIFQRLYFCFSALKEGLYILYMLEDIRCQIMERLCKKRKEMLKWNIICPRVQEKLEFEKDEARNCTTKVSDAMLFQVSHKLDILKVDMEKKTCTCRKWDLTGIPCCHAVSCAFYLRHKAEEYVGDYLRTTTYAKSYQVSIAPCVGEKHWPEKESPLQPPLIKIGPGRPKKNRRKDPYEDLKRPGKLTRHGQTMHCSVCRSSTHTKRKCPDKNKVADQPAMKRCRGRPRKTNEAPNSRENQDDVHNRTAVSTRREGRGRGIGGRGARGNRGDGQRNNVPRGYGVYVDSDGTTFANTSGQGGPLNISSMNISVQASRESITTPSSSHT